MSALAARTGLENATATNASGEAALLALFDFVAQRLAAGTAGAGVASAAELLLARNSLGLGAGVDVASAATLNLTSVAAQIMGVTGTVAVSAVSLNNGQTAVLIPAAALPLTYHATNNPVQGGQSYTCEVGDVVIYWKDNSGVLHNQLIKANGTAVTSVLGFRNKIINGGMAIDQRNAGASQTFTAAAELAYCVDRFYAYCTGANVTGQRVAGTAPNQYNYQFSGAASVTKIGFAQRMEAANTQDLAGQTATFSVDLANSLLTTVTWTAWRANTADTFGTLAAPTRTQIGTGTFTITSTLARYSAQISVPSAATTGIEVEVSVGAQTSGTWTIGRAQFELGAQATAFEVRPITHEMDACLRRTRKSYAQNVVPGTAYSPQTSNDNVTSAVGASGGGLMAATQDFDVEMAYAPTVTFWDHSGNAGKLSYLLNGNTWTANTTISSTAANTRRVFAGYASGVANNNGASFGYLAVSEL